MQLESFGGEQLNFVAAAEQSFLMMCLYFDRRALAEQYLGQDGEIVHWVRNRNTWPPSWAYIRQNDRHFVIFEGSTNIDQFAGHARGVFVKLDFIGDSEVNGAWWPVAQDVRKQLPDERTGRWHYCGHSYGGALAGILAMEHAEKPGPASGVELMTMGAPLYMTTGYDGPYPNTYWRVEAYGDLVPSLPPAGVELIGTKWKSPTEWLKRSWFFWGYGEPWFLNEYGGVEFHSGTFENLGEKVSVGMPGAHKIENYWGRINSWGKRNDPTNQRLAIALEYGRAAVTGGHPQIEVGNLPEVFIGPSGELERIPTLWEVGIFGGTGAKFMFKVDLIFKGKNNSTWRESHYLNSGTAYGAASKMAAVDLLERRLAFLSSMYSVEAVEAVEVGMDKPGYYLTVRKEGKAAATTTTETTGSALMLGYFDATNRVRWAMLRGFSDQQVGFKTDTGQKFISVATDTAIGSWVNGLATAEFGWVTRVRKTPDQPVTQPNIVLSLNGTTYPGLTVVTCAATVQAPNMLVSFHGFDKRILPGLNGLRKVIDTNAATFRIPYTIPRGGVVEPGNGAYVRAYQPDDFRQYVDTGRKMGRVLSKRTKQCCA